MESLPQPREQGQVISSALTALLRACTKNKDLCRGSRVHEDILRRGLLNKCSDALITMYAKCGALARAKEMFDLHNSKDLLTWTALIAGFVQNGHGEHALTYFEQMQEEGLRPDVVTFSCILKACGSIGAIRKGEEIHDDVAKQGLLTDNTVLTTALVDMYAKCGDLTKSRHVFEELPVRNVVSWTALIAGYTRKGEAELALNCYEQMKCEGLPGNEVTLLCILKACGTLKAAAIGEKIHDGIAKQGLLQKSIALGNALVHMYAKCGALAKAQQVLEELPKRDVTSWSALIAGYTEKGKGMQVLSCFEQMQREGLSPNAVTFISLLKACGNMCAIDKGEEIHDAIARQGLLGSNTTLGNALIDMYAKCGALLKARQVLEGLPVRDIISWNTLISGYAQNGEDEQALNCFEGMQSEGLSPNALTFTSVLKACGSMGAADTGEEICDEIAKQGLLNNDFVLATAVIDMYAKCGALVKARQVLKEHPIRNVPLWNALIAGYAQQCDGAQALHCFEELRCEGLSPDAVSFSCLLSACGRSGLEADAWTLFMNVATDFGIRRDLEHYTCMVDLFGRAGNIEKAIHVMAHLPLADRALWSAMLGACEKWGDDNYGVWAFENAVQVDKTHAGHYVLMANAYAAEDENGPGERAQSWWFGKSGNGIESMFNRICAKRV